MAETTKNPSDPLGALDRLIREIRSRLQSGGPEVNYPALYAYAADALGRDDRLLVAQQIATWQQWHDAYWQIREAVDSEEMDRGPVEEILIGKPLAEAGFRIVGRFCVAKKMDLLPTFPWGRGYPVFFPDSQPKEGDELYSPTWCRILAAGKPASGEGATSADHYLLEFNGQFPYAVGMEDITTEVVTYFLELFYAASKTMVLWNFPHYKYMPTAEVALTSEQFRCSSEWIDKAAAKVEIQVALAISLTWFQVLEFVRDIFASFNRSFTAAKTLAWHLHQEHESKPAP